MNFDAIIIGSGFGATVAATRLAEQGKTFVILERGTWWVTPEKLGKPPASPKPSLPTWAGQQRPAHPVQYWPRPDHKEGLLDLFASIYSEHNRDGLYRYSFFDQAHVLTASGVGGGSLIYSNVTLKPPDEVIAQLKDRHGFNLNQNHYDDANDWMQRNRGKLSQIVTKIPLPGVDVGKLDEKQAYLYLDRSRALRDAAPEVFKKLGLAVPEKPWKPLDLAVTEYDDRGAEERDSAASLHTFCERQGRCFLGCLPAARHTLNKTIFSKLLTEKNAPNGAPFNATLWPLAEARSVEPVQGGYAVHFRDHRDESDKTVTAKMVFLAGGVLGTTEVLLRSAGRLPLSERLGQQFSTNGDFAAFAVGTANSVFSTRGPINTCHVGLNVDGTHINVEDCSIPPMFAALASTTLNVLDNFIQREAFKAVLHTSWLAKRLIDLRDFLPSLPNPADPAAFRTEAEMVQNIFFFNVMAQDDATGVFKLDDDELDLDWDTPVAEQPVFRKIEDVLRAFTSAMGAQYVPFPLWRGFAKKKLIIVHPLGGCPVGRTRDDGVVNEFGQVFDSSKREDPRAVHEGLYVVDGSAIPGALSVNPTYTIVAQARKVMRRALPLTSEPTLDSFEAKRKAAQVPGTISRVAERGGAETPPTTEAPWPVEGL